MRGLDGNYINAQGDHSSRMQVVMQAEQDRQQIRAQLEANETVRKLKESVNETEKKNGTGGPLRAADDRGSGGRSARGEGELPEEHGPGASEDGGGSGEGPAAGPPAHIDIRV